MLQKAARDAHFSPKWVKWPKEEIRLAMPPMKQFGLALISVDP
jgi:hypothetical protein